MFLPRVVRKKTQGNARAFAGFSASNPIPISADAKGGQAKAGRSNARDIVMGGVEWRIVLTGPVGN
jgi:hypothetical protein